MSGKHSRQIFLRRDAPDRAQVVRRRWMFRHPVAIRISHWINAVCLTLLLMSGLQIFNAHPALYWGKASSFDDPALSMTAPSSLFAGERGVTTIGSHSFDTTGVLGLSYDEVGNPVARAFPSWATLPSGQDLATGRRWHFLFAWLLVINGLAYLVFGLLTGQLRDRVLPARDQIRGFWESVREHLLLRFARGDDAKRYNIIQKLTYLGVIFVLLPLQVLAGLAMSPAMDAAAPVLLDLFGGRQSARTVHFIVAGLLTLFVIVHVSTPAKRCIGWRIIIGSLLAGSLQAAAARSVIVTVGAIAFTRMPCGPSSLAITRVAPSKPAFDAA